MESINTKSRICRKCGAIFSGTYCKVCKAVRQKNRYEIGKTLPNLGENISVWTGKPLKPFKQWYQENKEIEKKKAAEWYVKNKNLSFERNREWKKNNPEKYQECHKNYSKANSEKIKIKSQNRRALKKKNKGVISKDLISKLLRLQKGKCACCSLPLNDDFHLDHIVPLVLGGEHADSNIQLLRSECNLKKGGKHPVEYMQSQGFLL